MNEPAVATPTQEAGAPLSAFAVLCEAFQASTMIGPHARLLLNPSDRGNARMRPPAGLHLVLLVNCDGAPVKHWHVDENTARALRPVIDAA